MGVFSLALFYSLLDEASENLQTFQELSTNFPQFSWEEKLVAPLIATPNVDKAIEDK
jgi:hypothetical protein